MSQQPTRRQRTSDASAERGVAGALAAAICDVAAFRSQLDDPALTGRQRSSVRGQLRAAERRVARYHQMASRVAAVPHPAGSDGRHMVREP